MVCQVTAYGEARVVGRCRSQDVGVLIQVDRVWELQIAASVLNCSGKFRTILHEKACFCQLFFFFRFAPFFGGSCCACDKGRAMLGVFAAFIKKIPYLHILCPTLGLVGSNGVLQSRRLGCEVGSGVPLQILSTSSY